MKIRRVIALLLCLCLCVTAFAACGGTDAETEETPGAAESSAPDATAGVTDEGDESGEIVSARDTLVIGGASEPATIDPTNQSSLITSQMAHFLYSTLFTLDEEYNVVGDLVESYEIVSDTEWSFKIYEGVKFHDGTDLTTQDVKDTLEYCMTNDYCISFIASVSSVDIVDDYNFTITTSSPDSSLLANFCQACLSILPSEKLAEGWDFGAEPCGSGPYKFVSWTSGDSIVFEAFDEYFVHTPYIKNITWKFIPEASSRTIALEAGEIDFIFDPATTDLAMLDEEDGVTVLGVNGMTLFELTFNYETLDWWQDQNVRKAISACIDRDALVLASLNGYGSASYGCAPNGLAGETLENAVMGPDLELAQQYLDASDYEASDISFTLWVADGERSLAAQVIKSNLEQLGITCNVEIGDSATIVDEVALGNFDASIQGVANTNAIDFLRRRYHSDQIGSFNTSRYSTDELDAELDRISTILDVDERIAAVTELEAELNDLCMNIPLYTATVYRAYNSALAGVNFNGAYFTRYYDFYWTE